jgi:hypothetical protein
VQPGETSTVLPARAVNGPGGRQMSRGSDRSQRRKVGTTVGTSAVGTGIRMRNWPQPPKLGRRAVCRCPASGRNSDDFRRA